MAKKKCKCKKRGRPRKPGRPKGSKNKKKTKKKHTGRGVGALAMGAMKTLGPAIAAGLFSDMLVSNLKKGNGLRLLGK